MLRILEERNIRTIWSNDGNEVWFHAGDIGDELHLANIHKVLTNIDRDDKKKVINSVLTKGYNRNFKDSLNNRGEIFINEEAVYNIAFRSNKAEAKLFTKWVTGVLKQIRINGYYIATEKDEKWLGTRQKSKAVRKDFTDDIQEFVHYAKQQGSSKPEMYYKHFTKLVNDRLGIPKDIERDELNQDLLIDIIVLERMVAMQLRRLVNDDTPYKEVYKQIKLLIEQI